MKLIVAEKPSVAREIALALNAKSRGTGYFYNETYAITWCVGHLCTLKEPEDYDVKFKKWKFEDLPLLPKKYELKVIDRTRDQFDVVSGLMMKTHFTAVVNACDAGREGELIFDNVYRMAGCTLPVFRLWTSEALTPEVIKREFLQLKRSEEFSGLRLAARVRNCADWAIGINGTRALTLRANIFKEVISVGRVQTPTLSFLVKRELEIKNFNPVVFYTLTAQFKAKEGEYTGRYEYFSSEKNMKTHMISGKEELNRLKNIVSKEKFGTVKELETKDVKENPPLLFNLTELQKEANMRYALTAETTLQIAQALYEKHKAITYPRTDSRYLPENLRPELIPMFHGIKKTFETWPKTWSAHAEKNLRKELKNIFDDEGVSDHHALLPSKNFPSLFSMSDDEQKIYELICRRVFVTLSDTYISANTTVTTAIQDVPFLSRGKVTLQLGWKMMEYQREEKKKKEDDKETLPVLSLQEQVDVKKISDKEDKTKPPLRFSEADLLRAMQNPSYHCQEASDSERKILREKGIGTPATRAGIIQTLIGRGYCIREKNRLIATEKAIALIQNLKPEDLVSPLVTANWEQKLLEIEKGEYSAKAFSGDLEDFVRRIIQNSFDSSRALKKALAPIKKEAETHA